MAHHRVGLTRELSDEDLAEPTVVGFLDALEAAARDEQPWPPQATARERALLDYALALTRAPGRMTADHIRPLRDAGLSDAEILDANQVTAYYAYANRVVDGLGVELEQPPASFDEPTT